MSWCCMEGFDGLASYSELGLRSWRDVGAGLKFGTTAGRRGSAGIYDDTSGSTTERGIEYGGNFFRTTPLIISGGGTSDIELGFAFKLTGSGWDSKTSGFILPLASFRSASAEIMWVRLEIVAGVWTVRQGQTSTTYMTGNFPGGAGVGTRPTSDRWYYFTLLVSGYENSGGTTKQMYILIDGVQAAVFNTTTANASGTASIAVLRMAAANGVSANLESGDEVHYDDIVLCSGVGELFNASIVSPLASSTYMGPVRVDRVVGVADNVTFDDEFVASSGSDEYPMLDDATQDGDSTYVHSSTVGHTAQGGNWSGVGEPLDHNPSNIYGVKAQAVVRNAGDGIAVVRCDLAYISTRDAAGSPVYSLPPGGSYEGMHSFRAPGSGASDGDFGGSYNASTSPWVTGGSTGGIRYATPLLEYVSG